jgi:hypothetical protein
LRHALICSFCFALRRAFHLAIVSLTRQDTHLDPVTGTLRATGTREDTHLDPVTGTLRGTKEDAHLDPATATLRGRESVGLAGICRFGDS